MPAPTFDGNTLFDFGWTEVVGNPQVRVPIEMIPGANGGYAQMNGYGPRMIMCAGMISVESAVSQNAALADVKDVTVIPRAYVDGETMATYTSVDGVSYTNCVMQSYEQVGQPQTERTATGWKVYLRCRAIIVHLTP